MDQERRNEKGGEAHIPCPHFNITVIARGKVKGNSVIGAAAYQSGDKLYSEYEHEWKSGDHQERIIHKEILLPPNAPEKYRDRATLWNAVDASETKSTAQTARRIIMALPKELSREQNIDLIRNYCQTSFMDRGMIADFAVHDDNEGNPHAHVLLTISFTEDDPQSVLTKLDLTDGEWLLNAGAALFVSSGMNELQMAKFASDEKLTFTDIRRFTDSILDLAEKAAQYVIDAMDWRVEFGSGLERKEIPEIPVDAVREAVINAFAHRQLESGQSVEIAVYRSFIEIYSPGKFPEGVAPEQFIHEIRKPIRRNPLITRTFYYSKDMESFATGLKRIYDACKTVGCKVAFYGDDYGFTVRFYRHCGDGWNQGLSVSLEHHDTQGDTQSDSQASLSEKLTNIIQENSKITRKQMAEILSVSTSTIQRLLKDMPNIHYVGSGYSGHWEINDPE